MFDFLNDKERSLVRNFADNPDMIEAVKKVLLQGVYQQGTLKPGEAPEPLKNWAVGVTLNQTLDPSGRPKDNPANYEKIGQRVFAITEGLNYLEGGFKEIDSFKTVIAKEPSKNVAR